MDRLSVSRGQVVRFARRQVGPWFAIRKGLRFMLHELFCRSPGYGPIFPAIDFHDIPRACCFVEVSPQGKAVRQPDGRRWADRPLIKSSDSQPRPQLNHRGSVYRTVMIVEGVSGIARSSVSKTKRSLMWTLLCKRS